MSFFLFYLSVDILISLNNHHRLKWFWFYFRRVNQTKKRQSLQISYFPGKREPSIMVKREWDYWIARRTYVPSSSGKSGVIPWAWDPNLSTAKQFNTTNPETKTEKVFDNSDGRDAMRRAQLVLLVIAILSGRNLERWSKSKKPQAETACFSQ